MRKQGHTYHATGESVGVHERTVAGCISRYEAEGAKALKANRQGRPLDAGRSLNQTTETNTTSYRRQNTRSAEDGMRVVDAGSRERTHCTGIKEESDSFLSRMLISI